MTFRLQVDWASRMATVLLGNAREDHRPGKTGVGWAGPFDTRVAVAVFAAKEELGTGYGKVCFK